MKTQIETSFYNRKTFFKMNFIKFIFYIFLLSVFFLALYALISFITALIFAFIISYIFDPLLTFFERKHIPRFIVISLIFILIIIFFILLIILVKNYFPNQEKILNFENIVITNLTNLKKYLSQKINFINWDEIFSNIQANFDSEIRKKIPRLLAGLPNMFSLIIIVPFCVFFFLLNGREMKKKILSIVPNKYFEMSLITIAEIDNILGKYIRGTLFESLIMGILTSLGFYIAGFPPSTAIISGMLAGFANIIPYLGPLIGVIIGVSICVLNLIPADYINIIGLNASVVGVIFVIIIVQLIEELILKPTIIGKSVDLHPLLVMLGVIAGSNLFGFIGMLIAIPVIAVIKVMIVTLYKQLNEFQFLSNNLFNVTTKNIYFDDELE